MTHRNKTNDISDASTVNNGKKFILAWSVHQMPGSPAAVLQRHFIAIASPVVMSGISYMILKPVLLADTEFFAVCICVAVALLAFYLKIARQKSAYHYKIYEDYAELDHHVYYSELETGIIKTIAAICMLAFIGVALITGSILFLVGPAAMGFLASLKLMNWQNPVTHENSLPWNEYNFVTVDRKRRIIVTHRTDVTLGFEARLPDDELFEQYLNLLKRSLPATAEFTEKKWDLDLL